MRFLTGVVVVLLLVAGCGTSAPVDPGVRACEQVAAGHPADRAVGQLAAGSSVVGLAWSGARLRDAASVDEVEAASVQLTSVCRAWLAR